MQERSAGWALRGVGAGLGLLGLGALAIAPLEIICFSWFAPGGRFGYAGFGYGSFMFGNLAMQILGYYVIAAVALPLGVGHLQLRRWVRPAVLALLRVWWVLGVPLLAVLLFVLFASKDLPVIAGIAATAVAALSYVALPGLLRRFYESAGVRAALARGQPAESRVEAVGTPALAVATLEAGLALALQVLVFFGGLFPLGIGWATGLPALAMLDGAILSLLGLIWGALGRRRWAWLGAVAYVGTMLTLWTATLVHTRWVDLLDVLAFPPTEVAFLSGIPLRGLHLALLVALPLAGALALIVTARPAFSRAPDTPSAGVPPAWRGSGPRVAESGDRSTELA